MARFVLALMLLALTTSAVAQVFGLPFGGKSEESVSGVEKLIGELEALSIDKNFEERYRTLTLEIERQLDLKRSECAELGAAKSEKEVCFRGVVQSQRRYLTKAFEFKKRYLINIHETQIKDLEETQTKALKELERQF